MSEEVKMLEKQYLVTDAEAVHFMGPAVPPVLSTPSMIMWMELTCRDNAGPVLKSGDDTVGVNVNIKHLAATPVGMKVRVVSKLTKVEGRAYFFDVEAFDESEKIGEGSHQRVSVTPAKFAPLIINKKERIVHAG